VCCATSTTRSCQHRIDSTEMVPGDVCALEAGEKVPADMWLLATRSRPPILTRVLVERILLVSALMLVGAFGLFQYELGTGATEAEARTVAVNVFVLVETAYLVNCRSLTTSVRQIGLFSNPPLIAGMITMLALQVAFTYLPFFTVAFDSAPIDLASWGRIVAVALLVSTVVAAEKALRRRRGEKVMQ